MDRSTRSGERIRNRIMALMAVAVVALVVVIVVTSPKKDELPKDIAAIGGDSSSSKQQDSSSRSAGMQEELSTSEGKNSAESGGASENESKPESADKPSSVNSSASESKQEKPAAADDPYYEAAMPMLVNSTNKIPEGYKPDVEVIGSGSGYSYDRKAAVAYRAMAAAAKSEGISLVPVSAYRSNERQTTNFNNKIKEFENMGHTVEQAYAATALLIAVPGTSEHELGLAIDLNSLETSFENTKTFEWLFAHCAEYGFILRYPKDKTEITEISYEPWHYRYVGTNHAKIIMEKGICLEEYLSGTN